MATALGLKAFSLFGNLLGGAIDVVHSLTGKGNKNDDHSWEKPLPTDRRSPCPMLNALANHGYLPHDGKNISLARLISGFKDSINLAPDATLIVALKALQASSTGNILTIHLDDLNKHGIIEHDGSLTRHDIFSGDNHTFSPELFSKFISHFGTAEKITIEAAAGARKDRLAEAKAANPEFNMSSEDTRFSFIETASYLLVFGAGTEEARTDWIRVLFEEERLPFDEGFVRSSKSLGVGDLLALQKKVEAASAS